MRQGRRTSRICAWLPGAVGLALAPLLLPACDSMVSHGAAVEDRPTASAVRDPVLQDIPKPTGFQLAADRSMVTNIGRFRLAQCEYLGPGDAAQIKRFYEEYLPTAGFELRHWSLDRGEYSLDFESAAEVCNVRIHASGRGKSTVIVKVRPKAQGSVERESRVPLRRPD